MSYPSQLPPPVHSPSSPSLSQDNDMVSTLRAVQPEPIVAAPSEAFNHTVDPGLQTPTAANPGQDNPYNSPAPSQQSSQFLSPSMGAGEEDYDLARTTTSSSAFSTASSINGSVERGSKREKEWREHFDVSEDDGEELIETSGCALAKEILVHGRIFVSTLSVGFKANILGFKTKVHFPLNDVTSITPKMTALVIPNAIEFLTTDGTKYTFATLPSRDALLDLLLALWRSQAPDAYSSFLASQPDDAASTKSRRLSAASSRSSNSHDVEPTAPRSSRSESAPSAAASAVTGVQGKKAHMEGVQEDSASHPATKADTEAWPEKCLDVRFPTTPEKVFNLVFHDEEFIKKLWASLNFTDIKITPWANGKRSFEYTKPLSGSVGPSSAKCYFEDEIIHEDADGWYGVVTITKTPDVPSGKSFEVHTKTCITWEGGQKGGARVVATSKVEWSGRSMLKSVINSSSIQGQKDYNKPLATAVRAHIKAHAAEFNPMGETNAGGDVDDEVDSSDDEDDSSPANASSDGPPSLMDYAMEDPIRTALFALLVISLLVHLWSWVRGGGGEGARIVKEGGKAWRRGAETREAMERLEKMEGEWEGLRRFLRGGLQEHGGAAEVVALPRAHVARH